MKLILIALLALSASCIAKPVIKLKPAILVGDVVFLNSVKYLVKKLDVCQTQKENLIFTKSCLVEIPDECFDSEGLFNDNLGHDTLDCGNL